jgi:hypothetical protein
VTTPTGALGYGENTSALRPAEVGMARWLRRSGGQRAVLPGRVHAVDPLDHRTRRTRESSTVDVRGSDD